MSTVILLFVAAIFCNSKIWNQHDYLSKEQTKYLKGIFAVLVLIHHLSDYVTVGIPAFLKRLDMLQLDSSFLFLLMVLSSSLNMEKDTMSKPFGKRNF